MDLQLTLRNEQREQTRRYASAPREAADTCNQKGTVHA